MRSSSTARQASVLSAHGLDRACGPCSVGSARHRNLLAHAPERLHEEISADYNDMIYAATREEIEKHRKAFIRKWRLKHRAVADSLQEAGEPLLPSRGCRRVSGGVFAPPTLLSGCMKSSSEGSRRKPYCHRRTADTAAMLLWTLLASGQISMRKVDGWQTLAAKPIAQPIDLAA